MKSKPALGNYRVKAITKAILQDFIKELFNRGLAINTISGVKGILTKAFGYAADNQYIAYSPAVRLKIPINQQPKVPTRSDPHIYILPSKMEEIFVRFPYGTVNHIHLLLGYRCGLRLGEAFGLIRADIKLSTQQLEVSRQVQWFADKTRTAKQKIVENGADDIYIQRRLGHVKLSTTYIYTNHLTDTVQVRGRSILNHMYL